MTISLDEMQTVAVLGAGTMGHGIAQVCAQAGFDTCLFDIAREPLDRGLLSIEKNLKKGVDRGKLDASAAEAALARLRGATDLSDAAQAADLVIEAVPEKIELKRSIFEQLDAIAPPRAILATNTSSLSVSEIAQALDSPERCVGMHFFNPAHILPLLEIVRGNETSDVVVETVRAVSERLGKTPITVRDSPGFASSRLGIALAMEAIRMVQDNVATAKDIDTAMELGYRHPMGPLKLTDLVGLDVRLSIAEYLAGAIGPHFEPPELLRQMVAEGRLGKKSGKGFYDWDE